MLGIGKSLIQMTYDRFRHQVPASNILVVTHEDYVDKVMQHLPEIHRSQVLAEPSRRNTAPCIAYAAYRIKKKDPNAVMIVAASDHLILKEDLFLQSINVAVQQANAYNCLLTLGIKPSRPDTGYGYIQYSEEEPEISVNECIRKVKTFTEKPNFELAKQFLDSGDFYWNSGMFVWNIRSLIEAFELHLPDINALFSEKEDMLDTPQEVDAIREIYSLSPNISVDYGIMEKAPNVLMLRAEDFGWSDLGTWGSLYTHLDHDNHENARIGKEIEFYESSGNIVCMPEKKLAVIEGLNNYIVVDTDEVLMIVRKEDEQRIKEFVNDLKSKKKDRFL